MGSLMGMGGMGMVSHGGSARNANVDEDGLPVSDDEEDQPLARSAADERKSRIELQQMMEDVGREEVTSSSVRRLPPLLLILFCVRVCILCPWKV